MSHLISIIVPVYNEARTVAAVIDRLLTIDLTPPPTSPFVVEIWHEYEGRPEVGALQLMAPQVQGSVEARRGRAVQDFAYSGGEATRALRGETLPGGQPIADDDRFKAAKRGTVSAPT